MKQMDFVPDFQAIELPVRVKASFAAMYDVWKERASDPDPCVHEPARKLLEDLKSAPELAEPFEDLSLLDKYAKEINALFKPLFPEPLQDNEIKAITMPFSNHLTNPTKRFAGIIERAGNAFQWRLSNFDPDQFYIMACIALLNGVYQAGIDYKQTYYFDIPNVLTGISRRYRAFINADFARFEPNENAIQLTQEDIQELIENFNDVELWRSKVPPESHDLLGFAIVTLFDVTEEEALSSMKNSLLQQHALQSEKLREEISTHMESYLGIRDVEVGFATYDEVTKKIKLMNEGDWNCMTVTDEGVLDSNACFCNVSFDEIFHKKGMFIVSDVTKVPVGDSLLIDRMREFNIQSFIVAPLMYDDKVLGFLEVSTEAPGIMNAVVASKLGSILPMFTVAMQRALSERENQLEAIVQEKFTALHPSVSWRFFEVAEEVLRDRTFDKPEKDADVVFRDVVPLYGQFDIRGSSNARNEAIQADLVKQLSLAESVMDSAHSTHRLPVYDHLRFRIQKYRNELENGIHAGDEIKILDFLNTEIYPVFNHLSTLGNELKGRVNTYIEQLDKELKVVYEERKRYENSVTQINEIISSLVETEQTKAQEMYPHYYEKYKTDGVEYNLYIGQSLQPSRPYNKVYLRNLRLWQLLLTAHIENRIKALQDSLPMPLEITSLILAHNSPLSIKFRQDEKKFDVDGAYNIRYEIMKKRIDKAFIKGTSERLTQPGKIAIVYSQDEEAQEYQQYLEYLSVLDIVDGDVEMLELEDLQGTSGLKALRATLRYSRDTSDHLKKIYSASEA